MNKYLKISVILAVVTWALFVASECRMTKTSLKDYVVEAGKQNFKPGESILPYFAPKGFEVLAVFDSSAWYGMDEWMNGDEVDGDWYDWNKLSGLTNYLTPNNKTTAMFAWRPDSTAYVIQVAAYTNDSRGGFTPGPVELVPCGNLFVGQVNWTSSVARYTYGEQTIDHEIRRPWIVRHAGTWIGGANNAPGPWGGKVHKEMKLSVEMRVR